MATYICSDLHGNYNVWYEIKKFLKKDDKLICLGDVIDRGPAGYSILVEMLGDPRVELFMGNHEDMMIRSCDLHLKGANTNISPTMANWIYGNGGNCTFEDWCLDPGRMEILEQMRNLPLKRLHINEKGLKIILCHAGCCSEDFYNDNIEDFDLLWDRNHFHFPWPKDEEFEDWMVIHGHTPIAKMMNWPDYVPTKALWYEGGHKIDIDCLTAFTNFTILLDIDTFEEHIIGEPIEEVLW